ncbi:MAG TPA: YCF48-related protein [Pyrinomonadaceae bacterium]|nr:YCF48-related protein [Pyrinomonadaceae bacterium]
MNLLLILLAIFLSNAPHWTSQTSGVNARLRGVSAVSAHVAWASGSGNTVLRTSDGGATWQKLVVSTDRLDFRDIDAIDERIAYVLSIGNGAASRIYKTTDAGRTWNLQFQATDEKVFLDAMSFWDEDHGLVIGDAVDGQFYILRTENGGRTWARVPPAGLPAALENEGAFAASGTNIAAFGKAHAWIGTGAANKARVLRTTDGGRSWKIAEAPIVSGASAGIFSIAFRDAKHGVVVGGDYKKEKESGNNLALTSDGGVTWTLGSGLSGFRSAVAYQPRVGAATLIAVGPSGADYSTDDGRTWRALEGRGYDTFSFVRDGSIGWGAGADGGLANMLF